MRFTNEAGWDRIARMILGAVVLYLGWSGTVEGGLGDFLKVFGFVPLLTGAVGWCPIYAASRSAPIAGGPVSQLQPSDGVQFGDKRGGRSQHRPSSLLSIPGVGERTRLP